MQCARLLLALAAAAALCGCGSEQRQIRIAVVPKGTTQSFWLGVKAGAEDAARENGAQVIWKGPAKETDVAGQKRIIENFINQKVDAIVMAACNEDALAPTVEQADRAGIPVIVIDSGVNSKAPKSFVATDNIAGARRAGEKLAELIGGKGKVGLIPFVKGAATSNMRERGFREAIREHSDIQLVSVLYSNSDIMQGMRATEDMLTANPDLAGIFAANEGGAVGAARALDLRRLGGKVKLVAFDAAPAQISALQKGTIQALVVQNPYRMGFDGVKSAIAALKGERVPARIDTGVTVVTKDNLDDPEVQKVLYPTRKQEMTFAICNEMFEGWEFEDVCAAARKAGYTGVEIAPFTLGELASDVSAEQRAELRAAAERQGVEIVGLHWLLAKTEGFSVNSPDAATRQRTARYLGELAELCADLGGKVMVFGSPKQRDVDPSLTFEQAWKFAVDTLREAAPSLEKHGVVLCLEPLSTQETNFINTAADAAQMVREIDSPAVQLLLDVKAMSSESQPIPDIIRANAKLLRHFHANDANLRGPGFGDTDFEPIARALKEVGYSGWVSVEVFDLKPDPVTIATNSMQYLSKCFAN